MEYNMAITKIKKGMSVMDEPGKNRQPRRKRISVSSKRQINIPKDFFDTLHIGKEMIAELHGNSIVLKPVKDNYVDFSKEILADIIAEGYTGEDILKEFEFRKAQIPMALEQLVEDAHKNSVKFEDVREELFGDLDEEGWC